MSSQKSNQLTRVLVVSPEVSKTPTNRPDRESYQLLTSKHIPKKRPKKVENAKKMKKFDKIQFFEFIGLLDKRLDKESLQFKSSLYLRLKSYLILFYQLSFILKFFVSTFFEREDIIQLWIGSPWNYLDPVPKFVMGLVGLLVAAWMITLFILFNHVIAKDNSRLWFKWMRMSREISPEKGTGYKVMGLSEEENRKFWDAEKNFNFYWYRVLSITFVFSFFVFGIQYSFVKFDVNIYVFVVVSVLQNIHLTHIVFIFFHQAYTNNLFYIYLIMYFAKKFRYISRQLEKIERSGSKLVDNRLLTRLIIAYNRVQFDLIDMNRFFRYFIGWNGLLYFFFSIMLSFIAISCNDLRTGFALGMMVILMFFTTIGVPFTIANQVPAQMNRARRSFENLSFRKSVNLTIKQKIDSISNVADTVGFSCFNWFTINAHLGFLIFAETSVYLLLCLQTYWLYRIGFYNQK